MLVLLLVLLYGTSIQAFAPIQSPLLWSRSNKFHVDIRTTSSSILRYPINNSLSSTENGNNGNESPLITVPAIQGSEGFSSSGNNANVREAIVNTGVTLAATASFGTAVWAIMGPKSGEEFFTGYLVEQSLSVDNLLVFLILFEYFNVPQESQTRVLKWGIIGAMTMRAIMILLGLAVLESFRPVLLVFAGILIYGSYNILTGEEEEEEDMSENWIVKLSSDLFDSTDFFDGDKFFTIVEGVKKATPLLLCLVAVEVSDIVFAVDSIPAVFGVTEDPFIVYTSNIFAILGLRSLFTVLSKAVQGLCYLEPAIAIVLGFIGTKFILEYVGIQVSTGLSLAVVTGVIGGGVGLSILQKIRASEIPEDAEDSCGF